MGIGSYKPSAEGHSVMSAMGCSSIIIVALMMVVPLRLAMANQPVVGIASQAAGQQRCGLVA